MKFKKCLELTRRPSFGFNFGLNLTPYKIVVASAPMICPVEFRLIPPRHFDSSNLFRVMGLEMVKRINYIYVWIYENCVKEFAPCPGVFLSPKVGDRKITRLSSFCLSPFSIFSRLLGLEAAYKFSEIKVKLKSHPKRAFYSLQR